MELKFVVYDIISRGSRRRLILETTPYSLFTARTHMPQVGRLLDSAREIPLRAHTCSLDTVDTGGAAEYVQGVIKLVCAVRGTPPLLRVVGDASSLAGAQLGLVRWVDARVLWSCAPSGCSIASWAAAVSGCSSPSVRRRLVNTRWYSLARLLPAALLLDDSSKPEVGGKGIRMVVAEDPAPVVSHLGEHQLGFTEPALLADRPGQLAASDEDEWMIVVHDLEPVGEHLAEDQLGVGIPAFPAEDAA